MEILDKVELSRGNRNEEIVHLLKESNIPIVL